MRMEWDPLAEDGFSAADGRHIFLHKLHPEVASFKNFILLSLLAVVCAIKT